MTLIPDQSRSTRVGGGMDAIKMEGFPYPLPRTARPDFRRPFSDGSMTIPTSDLAATLAGPHSMHQPLTPSHPHFMNPFSYDHQPFLQSFSYNNDTLPLAQHHQQHLNQPAQQQQAMQPPPASPFIDRARSLSRGTAASSGKAPRSRSGRKGSMTDVKPSVPRVRTASNRTMSYSHPDGTGRPIGLGLDTHIEGQHTDSVSPPDFAYSAPTAHAHSWNGSGSGSLPSMQSFGTTIDEAILDSPVSPALNLPVLPQDAADDEVKKQRRRECHNQVEKRRREHINTKIEELSQMLPLQYLQLDDGMEEEEEEEQLGSPSKKKKNRRNSIAKQKDLAHCKGRILSHSVQYINDLRHVNTLQAARILQLESLITGTNYSQPPSLLSQHSAQLFFDQHTQGQGQGNAGAGLEMLRPSPDPEPFPSGAAWNPFNPVFEPSPPEAYGNSSSSGSSAQPELKPTPTHLRHDSQLNLEIGMGGMDLDAVFARREEDSGLRW